MMNLKLKFYQEDKIICLNGLEERPQVQSTRFKKHQIQQNSALTKDTAYLKTLRLCNLELKF